MPTSEQLLSADDLPVSGSRRSGLVLRGERVSLAEWLEVSWFYPEGFRKERIIETARSWIVLGNDIVYKFLKVPHTAVKAADRFKMRWRLACEEVIDNRVLAPELYLGLRLLRWVDDEPQWISEKPSNELDPHRLPSGADDVAIVMRRLPEQHMLHRMLQQPAGVAERQLRAVALRLAKFHGDRDAHVRAASLYDADTSLLGIEDHYLKPLKKFILTDGSFLDSFSQLAFQEVYSYLSTFFAKNQKLFRDRVSRGTYLDSHGSLRADRISFSDTEHGKALSIFGRLGRLEPTRFADCIRDTAALAADIEARGAPQSAAEFEDSYFAQCSEEIFPELYRFYKVAEAASRAELLFRGKVDDRAVQGTSYLSLAFRYSLRLAKPFFLIIGGTAPEAESALAKSIGELTSSVTVSAEDLPEVFLDNTFPDELLLERLLRDIEKIIGTNQSAVFLWPLNREEERIRIAAFAERLQSPYLFVQCETGKGSPPVASSNGTDCLRRNVRSNALSRYTPTATGFAPQIVLEPVLPLPDQGLYVLRQLHQPA